MKKYIFMALAGMLALSSCSNDDNDMTQEKNAPRQMTFTAGFGGDGAQTRASISGKAVSFDTNDSFSILSANNTTAVEFSTTDGTNFSGMASDAPKFYAVYPYNPYNPVTLDSSTGIISRITIPPMQYPTFTGDYGWDPVAPIAYATTTGSSLEFHNACALLKVTNGTETKGDIQIQDISLSGAAMAGAFYLNTSTGELTVNNSVYEPNTSVWACDVPAGKTVYIAIAPCTVGKLEARFLSDIGKLKTKTTSTTFEKGKIYDLGNVSEWPDKPVDL